MLSLLRSVLIIAVLATGASVFAQGPRPTDDGYWKNYWRWYDNDYRPYYSRQYRDYGYRNDPYSSNRYGDSPYTYGYYGDRYNRNPYDGRDPYNYNRDPYRSRGNSVNVNGFRFQWR